MRNNKKLSQILHEFEDSWCMGTEHLLDSKNLKHFI